MGIYTKRNALVGFAVLRLLGRYRNRAQHRRRMRALKIGLVVALAIVSAGVLAAVVLAGRRSRLEADADAVQAGVADESQAEPAPGSSANGQQAAEPLSAA